MNSLDNTPLRYKNRSPLLNFFNKNLSKAKRNQNATLMSHRQHSRVFKTESNNFDVFPVVKTPPPKRFSKIVNPFEAALSERLHLPIIASPTLFQRPQTPQHSSTQFAWTIDDVSSLQPANVEPYETQFHDSPDPDFEAKVQSAISSFFKEQQIVPSPIDCPLRSQRIILSENTGNTPISKPGRRIRDNVAQTVLSLPPSLPKDLEDALAPYFMFTECQQSTSSLTDTSISAIEYDLRDASLRRKLFDHQGVSCMEDETFADVEHCQLTTTSPPPQSPEVLKSKTAKFDEAFKSRLSDPMDKSSFGSLSPIAPSKSSPDLKRTSLFNFCNNDVVAASYLYEHYRCPKVDDFASPVAKKSPFNIFTTPERSLVYRSSSPYGVGSEKNDTAFNNKISGLLVDTSKRPRASAELDLFADETQDVDEDEMQVSQLSAISNVSSESDTPRSKRRSTSRKNLSQSFTNQQISNDNESENNIIQDQLLETDKNFESSTNRSPEVNTTTKSNRNTTASERSVLYRTDSGFNEMTSSCSTQCDTKPAFQLSGEEEKTANGNAYDGDVSMICCSTPSKHSAIS